MMTDSKIYPSIFQTAYPMEGHVDAKSVLGYEQGNTLHMCVDQTQWIAVMRGWLTFTLMWRTA